MRRTAAAHIIGDTIMRNSVVIRSALICGVLAVAGYMYVMARNLARDKESSAFVQSTVIAVGAQVWQRTPHPRADQR